MIIAFYINVMHEFIETVVRKTFPSESPIISIVMHLTIKNLINCIKLIVTIKLRLDVTKYHNRFTNSFELIRTIN